MSVSFQCRGHSAIAGTHGKTLELTREHQVTRRATCVLGVDSNHDDGALLALRGVVEVTLECGRLSDTFTATVTPFFVGDDSLVFRRGPALRGRTFAFDSTKIAADIDRELVGALADPNAVLDVTMRQLDREGRGVLFVVAVPIGNDDDLSPRARRVLEAADVVLAEDTRRFRDLAQRGGLHLRGSVASYHDANEAARSDEAIARMAEGARVALVSDAGTPLFSDPGYVVVSKALDAGFEVTPVPGPSSLLAVLSASGLAIDRFTYVGFLPRRSAARQAELRRLTDRRETFVLHEAPHRVGALLADLAAVCPDWRVCAGREVTKVFEEFRRGTVRELAERHATEDARGEFTLVVAPPANAVRVADADTDAQLDRLVRALLEQGVTSRTLALALADLPGVSRKEAYARVLAVADAQ
ncbi:MAG TPA: 16S rRNA (cytidine(1402)-2'-O)-methyltransferase [Acidimicrobiia bacterium]|nr:16S rRNA (cytidine(1402)-2'-O)-methyltransferase [Acidimicrobiia bacterium]